MVLSCVDLMSRSSSAPFLLLLSMRGLLDEGLVLGHLIRRARRWPVLNIVIRLLELMNLILEGESLFSGSLLTDGHQLRWSSIVELTQEGVLLGQARDFAPLVYISTRAPLLAEVVPSLGRVDSVVRIL